MKKLFFSLLLFLSAFVIYAQDSAAIKFSYSQQRISDNEVALTITAKVAQPGVKLFAIQKTDEDPVYSLVHFDTSATRYLKDSVTEKGNIVKETDPLLQMEVQSVSDSVQWTQVVNIAANDSAIVKGTIAYMYKNGEEFPSAEEAFRFVIMPGQEHVQTGQAATATAANTGDGDKKDKNSLWWIFLAAFGGGLLALLTPCIYAMIPVTVSFFLKRSKSKKDGVRNAIIYALSIITIFTLAGFLITIIFGPAALNNLATNWIANLIFFAIFMLFGFSFLGAFEIELPSSWSTKADSKAGTGSIMGIFFMALTLVIVSFSCTGPIIGPLLAVASMDNYYGPLVGMFGFSLALALPFALFAFFPERLNMLGKAGGWLNSVKVTLGFLELALALKFLSNADLARNWRILDREIFIVLWVVIFLLLGLYLLGKLKFRHDDDLPKNDFGIPFLTVTRLMFAIASLSIAVYLIPGLWGAPLKGLSAFVPPMGTQDFNADDLPKGFRLDDLKGGGGTNVSGDSASTTFHLPEPQRFAEIMKTKEPEVVINNSMVTYFDYEEALEVSRKANKPLMIDFTGINCVNCREMEGRVWSDPEVMRRLKNNFVIASLFVDVHHGVDLPISEQYYSEALKKNIETLGDKNTDIQVTRFGSNSQPFYFFLDQNEQRLAPDGYAYDPSISNFIGHLDKVVEEYKKRQQ